MSPQLELALLAAAARFPDFQFVTEDGRSFVLVTEDRFDIRARIAALGHVLGKTEREELMIVAGVIVEIGSSHPPMIFHDFRSLENAWLVLHESFEVELTEGEQLWSQLNDKEMES